MDQEAVSGDLSPDGNADADGDLIGAIVRLDELVRTLRRQCPWDREQTHTSLRRYLLEETYETLEALDARTDPGSGVGGGASEGSHIEDLDRNLCEELGDLLYQVWFQAHLASERDAFDMADVAREVRTKLVARHPHVFGDVEARDADAVRGMWDAIKLREKGRGLGDGRHTGNAARTAAGGEGAEASCFGRGSLPMTGTSASSPRPNRPWRTFAPTAASRSSVSCCWPRWSWAGASRLIPRMPCGPPPSALGRRYRALEQEPG